MKYVDVELTRRIEETVIIRIPDNDYTPPMEELIDNYTYYEKLPEGGKEMQKTTDYGPWGQLGVYDV